jgi:hypothetical protein
VLLAGVVATLAVVAAGCGGSEESEATSTNPIGEVREVRRLLDTALTRYRAGDAEAAQQTVGDAYLEHFEHVEQPLENESKELMEDLEHLLSTEVRDRMKAAVPDAEVVALVAEAKAGLAKAEQLLGAAS